MKATRQSRAHYSFERSLLKFHPSLGVLGLGLAMTNRLMKKRAQLHAHRKPSEESVEADVQQAACVSSIHWMYKTVVAPEAFLQQQPLSLSPLKCQVTMSDTRNHSHMPLPSIGEGRQHQVSNGTTMSLPLPALRRKEDMEPPKRHGTFSSLRSVLSHSQAKKKLLKAVQTVMRTAATTAYLARLAQKRKEPLRKRVQDTRANQC